MTSAQIWMSVSIVAYLIFVVGIGIVCMKKNNECRGFLPRRKEAGPFVTAMSAEASDMSSYLLMGLAGSCVSVRPFGSRLDGYRPRSRYYLNWLIVAKRIRNYTEICGNSITVPEFLSKRYKR